MKSLCWHLGVLEGYLLGTGAPAWATDSLQALFDHIHAAPQPPQEAKTNLPLADSAHADSAPEAEDSPETSVTSPCAEPPQ